jgi:hypothetical protein
MTEITNFDKILNFVHNRTKMLCEIYIKELASQGIGILMITIDTNNNITTSNPNEVNYF